MTEPVYYLATIPSPTRGLWHLGPVPVHASALFVLIGIGVACWITEARLRLRGAPKWLVVDVAVWAVPFGLVGGRLYHLITSPDRYFGKGGHPVDALKIWEGGLGIWGAVALGGVGAWLACRRLGVPLTMFADALAPGLPAAQAIGRLGNWFNNELYGGHTNLPWGLTIYQYDPKTGSALIDANGNPLVAPGGPFHPTFLYELVWDVGVALLVYLVDRRWKLGKARAFALYVMAYTVGRFWIEAMRTDQAHVFLGMRVNSWVALTVFAGAQAYFLRVKGAQEHLRTDEDGTVHVVSEDGTPIEGYAAFKPRSAGVGFGAAGPKELDTVSPAMPVGDPTGEVPRGDVSEPDTGVRRFLRITWAATRAAAGEPGKFSRRFLRLRWAALAAIAGLAALTVFVSVTAVGADNRATLADQQRQESQRQQRLASARQLAAQASQVGASDPRLSVRLDIAALTIQPDLEEARASIVRANVTTYIRASLYGHTRAVWSVAFSPDGHTMATASQDSTVILWDLTDGSRPRRLGTPLTGHTDRVNAVAFSPDGRTLATASSDKTAILWDLTDRTHPSQLGTPLTGHSGDIWSVAFAPDGRTLATASSDKTAILWDLTDRTHPSQLGTPLTGHSGDVYSVAFSPDGHTVATGSADATIIVWDITDRTRAHRLGTPLTGHGSAVFSVAFSPDGRTLATGSIDDKVMLWDLTDRARGQRIGTLTGHTANVYSVAFSPDGHTLASASGDATVIVWDITDRTRAHRLGTPLTGHAADVYSVAFSPDGHTLATGSTDGTAIVWDVSELVSPSDHTPIATALTGHAADVYSVAFAPDGHTLATASADHTAMLWDLTDRTHPTRLGASLTGHTDSVNAVAFSPDGHTLVTASADHTAMLWDLTDRTHPTRLGASLTGHTDSVNAVAFSPDGRTMATASTDATVILWDITDRNRPRRIGSPLTGHSGTIWSVAFSPDGYTLATASSDLSVIMWDLTDRGHPMQLARFGQLSPERAGLQAGHTDEIRTVAFSPSGGRTLATGSFDTTALLWDVTSRAVPSQIGAPLEGHKGPIWSVAFSPDGLILATASQDGTVMLWDLAERFQPAPLGGPLAGHAGEVRSVTFSPDGYTLATAGSDHTVMLWDLTTLNPRRSHALDQACAFAGRALTREEWARYVGDGLPYVDKCAA